MFEFIKSYLKNHQKLKMMKEENKWATPAGVSDTLGDMSVMVDHRGSYNARHMTTNQKNQKKLQKYLLLQNKHWKNWNGWKQHGL